MTDNEVMIHIIDWMMLQSKNKEYINKLNIIKRGIVGKKHIEEFDNPRHKSIILFGYNIFPFKMNEYRNMVEEINDAKQ